MKLKRKMTKFGTPVAAAVVAVTMCASLGLSNMSPAWVNASETSAKEKYSSEYDSFEQVLEAGKDLNLDIAAEGFVLLKNANNALPLKKTENKVTVLGSAADELSLGGAGSGALRQPGSSHGLDVADEKAATIYDALEAVGIEANPRIRSRYLSVNSVDSGVGSHGGSNKREGGHYMDIAAEGASGEVEFGGKQYVSAQDGSLAGCESNYKLYGDAAIVVISRTGSENNDNPANNVGGHSDPSEHYLELDDAEKELMAYAKLHFDRVILVLNSPAVMELGTLQDDNGIDSIIWIGQPGWNGILALGGILTGAINPSGRTVDLYMRDFTTDPTWYNFGDYSSAAYAVTGKYTAGMTMGADPNGIGLTHTENLVDYAEGIYVGYKYYETVAADLGDAGEKWYSENVVYPFGYGLSYTTFTQSIEKIEGDLSDAEGSVEVSVKVTNTGKVAGKDVVQLYSTPPYTAGGIDKAAVNLLAFDKSDMLAPGESQIVKVEFNVKDLASFDYNDANKNNNSGYELETGDYVISLRANSHDVYDSKTLSAAKLLAWDEDGDASTPNNIYSQNSDSKWAQSNTLANNWTVSGEDHYLTRDKLLNKNGTEPSDLKELAWLFDESENQFKDEAFFIAMALDDDKCNSVSRDLDNVLTEDVEDDYENLWYIKEVPSTWTQGAGVEGDDGMYKTVLSDMIGVDYDDDKWDEFLNQLTWEELVDMASHANFSNRANRHIGKDEVADDDGPGQFYDGWAWVCAVVVASTWNTDLAYEQGRIIGNESMWMEGADQGGSKGRTNGWYGPAVNIHRNPLGGRNFEYYSQDGMQSALVASAVVKGATDMGCHVYLKHAFLNEQETNRGGLVTFATEQAIREIYAKPFEISIKDGNCNGIMHALNLIGLESTSSWTTNVQLYSNEWGYRGLSVTDWFVGSMNTGTSGYQMVRGLVLPLGNNDGNDKILGSWDAGKRAGKGNVVVNGEESLTQWYWTRELVKRMCYTSVNSNGASNGYYGGYLEDTSIDATYGKDMNYQIFGSNTGRVVDAFGSTAAFTVEITGLPKGVSYDATTCKLVGKPVQTGRFDVKVDFAGNGGYAYIKDSAVLTITVAPDPNPEGSDVYLDNKTATFGTEYTGTISQNITNSSNYVPNGAVNKDNVGKYVAYEFIASNLPEGLHLDAATGRIEGNPDQFGTFEVSITTRLKKVTESVNWWSGTVSYRTTNEDHTTIIALTVAANGAFNVVFDANYAGGNVQNVAVTSEGATLESILGRADMPERDGYTFLGWATSADAVVPDVEADATVIDGTVTYYAVWKAPEIAIIDGNWYINGIDTGISAVGVPGADGQDGQNGQNGQDGQDGVGIVSFEKVGTEGLVDTYKITMSNGQTYTFTVTNGADGADGQDGADGKDGSNGGCNGSVAATSVTVGSALLLAAGAYVALKLIKKRNNK